MAKRKSKTTAEFKPPKRAKRQKSTEATNQSEDENQTLTPESENNNSHNALCSDKLDEHQPGQSTLQDTQTTEFPVDPCCSLEEKTSHYDNNEFGNGTNPLSHEIEQTAAVPLQTPELDKSNKHTLSRPLNTEAINVDQPNRELDDEEREITRNSNHQSQKVPDDCDSELPSDEHQTERESSHEGNTATEPKMDEQLGSSDIVAETSYDQIQMPEDAGSADPLVKRNIRKRMGMCRLGERKKMPKGQPARGNVFEGSQENEAGEITNEGPVMTSDGLKKDISISVEEEGVTESEVSVPSFSTPCPMEDTPVQEQQEQPGNEVQILVKCMSREPVTHETDNAIPSHADDLNPLEQNETECMEQNATESNIREDSNEVTTEIGTEVPVDFAEVCKDSTDVSAQEEVVIAGSLEVPKEANEGSASASEVANQFGEELVAGGDETEQCSPCECDMNASTSDHTSEQCVELMDIAADETISAPPVIHEREDKCESSDFSQVAAIVTAENKADWEDNSVSSLSIPAAPPGGDNEDGQSFTERVSLLRDAHEPHRSPAAEPDPSSPLSMHSVTDSQLNNIPLSLEDLPISEAFCDLEDATELVCGLIRDIASLNQLLMDARRQIGFGQQGRKPLLHTQKYRHNTNRF